MTALPTPQQQAHLQIFTYLNDERIDLATYDASLPPHAALAYYPYTIRQEESIAVNLRRALTAAGLLPMPQADLRILVSGRTTFIPITYFQEEGMQQIYYHNFPDRRGSHVFYDSLTGLNAVLLFSLPDTLYRLLRSFAPQAYYIATSTPLLRHFATIAAAYDKGLCLFAFFEGNEIDVSVFAGEELRMANKYETKSMEDAAYYLLNCATHTGLDAKQDMIYLVGNVRYEERLITLLRRYIAHVEPLSATATAPCGLSLPTTMPYPLWLQLNSTLGHYC